VEVKEYGLSIEGGLAALKRGKRVNADAARQIYYGQGDGGLLAVDGQTGASQQIPIPSSLGREGWLMGTAFDTLRSRALLVTLGGEGFVYGYFPSARAWTTAFSMQNRDFDCLEYHAATDTIYGVTLSYEDSVYSKLVGLRAADGTVAQEIPLPVFPFDIDHSGHAAEVVSTGQYLVLLIQPRPNFYGSNRGIPESRIYLFDPRTRELWLTYRSSNQTNQRPQVQIVSPADGASVPGERTVRITAEATDSDGSIESVEFFVDGRSIGFGTRGDGSKYFTDWVVPPAGNPSITAQAEDNQGQLGVSTPVVVQVNRTPFVGIIEPENGSTLQLQAPVLLKAIATDAEDPITGVSFIIDGLPFGPARRLEGTDLFVARWTPTTSGRHTIQARAASAGAVSFSNVITVRVEGTGLSVTITSPPGGSNFVQFSLVELVATVAATEEVSSVEFFVDGASVGRGRRRENMTFTQLWVARGVSDHVITARATARSGATATSDPVSVTVTSEGGTAHRLLPAQYRPGRAVRVGILVAPGRGAGTYGITETPPAGWRISEISDGGTYNAQTGKVVFGPSPARGVQLLTYVATPPEGERGTKTFSGSLDVDGVSAAIGGKQTIDSQQAKRVWRRFKVCVK
jgi:hypothetical protein